MTSPTPTFSVIIPLYNKERYLPASLGSLLSQTVLPSEIIIVNDCSTDNGYAVARTFAAQSTHPDLFIFSENKQNSGPGTTRNNGIALATSEYVLFLDADDQLAPNHIQNLADCITQYQSKLIITRVFQTTSLRTLPTEYIRQHGEQVSDRFFKLNDPLGVMKHEMIFVSANYCFQKPYFNDIHFSSERNFEDWLFCYHLLKKLLAQKEHIWMVEEPSYRYAEDDPASLSSNNVTDINRFVLPQLYFELDADGQTPIRTYIFSIWFFNAMKRCATTGLKVKLLMRHIGHVLRNFSLNKYYLSSFVIIFINRNRIEQLIQRFKKAA